MVMFLFQLNIGVYLKLPSGHWSKYFIQELLDFPSKLSCFVLVVVVDEFLYKGIVELLRKGHRYRGPALLSGLFEMICSTLPRSQCLD